MVKSVKSTSSSNKKSKKGSGKLGKINLNPNELEKNAFYCVKCRALCFSRGPDVKVGKSKNGRNVLKGKCANKAKKGTVPKGPNGTCGTKLNRFF